MASSSLSIRMIFVTVFMFNNIGFGSGIHVEIDPENFNELTTQEINVTCVAEGDAYWAKRVFVLELGKTGQPPMAVYNCQELTYGPNIKTNIQAEGRIEKNARKSYLRLTIKDPGMDDTGPYKCVIFYLDELFEMKKEIAEANVTSDNGNLKSVVKHLLTRVSFLEDQLSNQQNATRDQLESLQTIAANQERQLQTQESQIKQLLEKHNTTSAFFAGNSYEGILTKGELLKFQNMKENIGEDYNSTTGIYTAPVDGLYAFHLFAMSFEPNQSSKYRDIQVSILANEVNVATLLAEDTDLYDQSSVSCVVKLKAGETVKCLIIYVNDPMLRLFPFPYSGFSGHLIKPF